MARHRPDDDQSQPEDPAARGEDRLAFARTAYNQKRFALAARLWAAALEADPNLFDDRHLQHRYSAARAAVLVQLEKYISDKALWVPLWDPYTYTALQPRVKGAFLDARGRVILNNATIS
jgi:hypothetical protein